jgi:hypothetical protein
MKTEMKQKPMTKFYLASRYSRREQLCSYRTDLETIGHKVTSRWLDGNHEIEKEGSTQAARTRFALEDWSDMMEADVCISITEEPRKTTTRGGRHVEFGGALAAGKYCIVIGHRENVFHCLPQVRFFETWKQCLEWLKEKSIF